MARACMEGPQPRHASLQALPHAGAWPAWCMGAKKGSQHLSTPLQMFPPCSIM